MIPMDFATSQKQCQDHKESIQNLEERLKKIKLKNKSLTTMNRKRKHSEQDISSREVQEKIPQEVSLTQEDTSLVPNILEEW